MSQARGRTVIVVNPRSRAGETERRLAELEGLLRRHLSDYQVVLTRGEGDGERLAREAVQQGASRLVVAGGDGTVSEVLGGLLAAREHLEGPGRGASAADVQADTELALLPLGSGGDFARALGLNRDLAQAVARLESGRSRRVDVGRMTYQDREHGTRTRWFLNIASFGMTGDAMLWLAEQGRLGKRGALSYVEGGLRALFAYRMPRVRVSVDGREVHRGPLLLGAIANGPCFGGGMRVAPQARIDDGAFDVVLAGGLSKPAALALFPRLLLGRHVNHPRIAVVRGRRVELESAHEVWLEADGEPVGVLPASLELVPSALNIVGLP
jgi:diacylglycerol kinase (ATP)